MLMLEIEVPIAIIRLHAGMHPPVAMGVCPIGSFKSAHRIPMAVYFVGTSE